MKSFRWAFTRASRRVFHLEGLPFLLGGVIQAIHDPHTAGIRFLDMSQRKMEQIQLLIQEIEEMRNKPPAAQEGHRKLKTDEA